MNSENSFERRKKTLISIQGIFHIPIVKNIISDCDPNIEHHFLWNNITYK